MVRGPAAQYETPPSRAHSPAPMRSAPKAARPESLNIQDRPNPAPGSIAAQYQEIYDPTPPSPGVDERPFLQFAIEQLTRDEEVMGWAPRDSDPELAFSEDRTISQEGLIPPNPAPPAPVAIPGPQPKPVSQPAHPPPVPTRPQKALTEPFRSIDPPEGCPSTGYLPVALRLPTLLLFIFLCTIIIAALIFCNVYSRRHGGLLDYDGTGTSSYFVFQYLPQILGMVVILWVFILQAAVYRIIPFVSLTSERHSSQALQDMSIYPANFLVPDFRHFKWGEPMVGVSLILFWVSFFTIPLLSCMFQTQLFTETAPVWRWTSVQAVVYVLIVLYVLLILAAILVVVRFRPRYSPLVADPSSLAAIFGLFSHSNILNTLEQSELSGPSLPPNPLRLGYYTHPTQATPFYTIANPVVPPQSRRLTALAVSEKRLSTFNNSTFTVDYMRYSHAESFTRNIHSPFFRYRWTPWFLRDTTVVAWIVAALTLYIAFLAVSFARGAVARGFPPRLSTATNTSGFSASNFLYSFLPSLLGMGLFLAVQPIIVFFSTAQAFANLSPPDGALAADCLDLTYPSTPLPLLPVSALLRRSTKLAVLSFAGLSSTTLPVLAGGVFSAQVFQRTEVRVAASMPGYIALCVFLGIYAFSFLAAWPTRKRYLPHELGSVGSLLSWAYTSTAVVGEPSPTGKAEGPVGAARWHFGLFVGCDGREHLGIERVGGGFSTSGSGSGSGNGSGEDSVVGSRDYLNGQRR